MPTLSFRSTVETGLDGSCPLCPCERGLYSDLTEVIECKACGTPWPSSYWNEQE